MRKFIILIIFFLIGCTKSYKENEFINYDCNIPIIDCILNSDTVNLIVDTGAEYSLIDKEYYYNNKQKFRLVSTIETEFHGINGTRKSVSDIVVINSSFGYIPFVELDLKEVIKSKSQYKIVGILGSDFFKSNNYMIDFKLRKIYPCQQIDSIYGKSIN